jgi:hypothetical protein
MDENISPFSLLGLHLKNRKLKSQYHKLYHHELSNCVFSSPFTSRLGTAKFHLAMEDHAKSSDKSCCNRKPNVVYIFIAFLLHTISWSIYLPLLPQHIIDLCNHDLPTASRMAGIVTSCTSLATFLSSPLIGMLSDYFGRKKLFYIGLVRILYYYSSCFSSSKNNSIDESSCHLYLYYSFQIGHAIHYMSLIFSPNVYYIIASATLAGATR